jgi:hypothetical protein
MSKVPLVLLIAGLLFLAAVPVRAGSVYAVGEGWCENSAGGCNNTDLTTIASTFAGNIVGSGGYRNNWFVFNIPSIGLISNATLWIWNEGANYTDDTTRTYTLYNSAAIDFHSLGSGPVLGSVNVGVADSGVSHYVGILLNPTALSLLNAAQGSQFLFGGAIDLLDPAVEVELFAYDMGTPARLDYNSVPEPGTLTLLLGGLAVLGMAVRRRLA